MAGKSGIGVREPEGLVPFHKRVRLGSQRSLIRSFRQISGFEGDRNLPPVPQRRCGGTVDAVDSKSTGLWPYGCKSLHLYLLRFPSRPRASNSVPFQTPEGGCDVQFVRESLILPIKFTLVFSHKVMKNDKLTMECFLCKVNLDENNSYTVKNGSRKGKRQSYCKECNTKSTIARLRKNKQRAVNYMGSKCQICGYSKCNDALEFHHINPEEKEITPAKLRGLRWESQKIELDKCILLCSNCHREVHSKMREDPDFNIFDCVTY